MLQFECMDVPFFVWGDHYMFARGGFGDHRDLNFFVDSGLVSLHADGRGGIRPASTIDFDRMEYRFGATPR